MKLNRKWILIASLVLSVAMATSGTMAYLTSTDSDVNVMTLGNVEIEQHEYQRATSEDGSYETGTIDEQASYVLEAFEQGKPLLPFVGNYASGGWDNTPVRMTQVGSYGGMNVLVGENAVDKFVTVENTGNTDAYVRTLVAIEYGTGNPDLIGRSYHFTWTENMVGEIVIDSNNYYLYEYVYNGAEGVRHENDILPAGDTSYPNLAQIYLKSEATNEDCAALDGNGNGALDILVLSQAVQAAGFKNANDALDTAFGDITTTNHPWVKLVSSVEELEAAIAAGDTSVVLDGDISLNDVLEVNGELTILGNGNTITAPANGTRVVNVQDNTEDVVITLTGVTLNGGDVERGISFYNNSGALDVTIIACEIAADSYGVNIASDNANATLTVKDSTLTGWCAFQTWSANTVATFDNCILKGVNDMDNANGWTDFATVVINEDADNSTLTFNNCTIEATENSTAVQYHLWDRSDGSTVTWNNCTFIENGVEVENAITSAAE